MAEPFEGDIARVRFGPHSVEGRADLAVQIASICAEWALIEYDLKVLYGFLLGVDLPRQPPESLPRVHPVALQVFEALHPVNNRLELLKRLAHWNAPEDAEEIEKLVTAVKRASDARNRIAHGMWGITDEFPKDLILNKTMTDPLRRYRTHDFQQVRTQLREVHAAARERIGKVIMRLLDTE